MYVIISDNLEGYSDHIHCAVLVCETEEQAKKASALLLGWARRMCDHYRISGYRQRYEDIETPPCGVSADSLQIPGVPSTSPDFNNTISYFEIPKWAE
jgi:hypothetical protein